MRGWNGMNFGSFQLRPFHGSLTVTAVSKQRCCSSRQCSWKFSCFPPTLSPIAVEMLISDVTVTMEKRMREQGNPAGKGAVQALPCAPQGCVPIRDPSVPQGSLALEESTRLPCVCISFTLLREKCQKISSFAHLEKFTCCRIPFFESGPWAFTSSSGFWGLLWPVLFTEVPKSSLSPAGSSSALDAAALLIWTSSLWLLIGSESFPKQTRLSQGS